MKHNQQPKIRVNNYLIRAIICGELWVLLVVLVQALKRSEQRRQVGLCQVSGTKLLKASSLGTKMSYARPTSQKLDIY